MQRKRPFSSVLLGTVSFLVTFTVLWLGLRDTPSVQGHQIQWTACYLKRIHRRLDEMSRDTGKLPQTLSDLQDLHDVGIPLVSGQLVDAFGTPFQYDIEHGEPVVQSFGRDHKQGGIGIFADMRLGTTPIETRPTLHQLLFQLPAGKQFVLISIVIAGVVSYLCVLFSDCVPGNDGPRGWHWLSLREGKAAVAICVGILIIARALRAVGLFK
jgi:hypothetical protein